MLLPREVRGGEAVVLEGDWKPNRVVILEFDSVEKARAWWNSEEYTRARKIRHEASTGSMLILDGLPRG